MNLVIFALPLNLNLIEILIHLFNLTVLIIVIRVFFYKPINNFMNKRAEEFKKKEEESEIAFNESIKLKEEYQSLLKGARQEAILLKEETIQDAKNQASEIISKAKKSASEILITAEQESKQKADEKLEGLKMSISELAYKAAEKILEREVNQTDIDHQIDGIVKEWKNK